MDYRKIKEMIVLFGLVVVEVTRYVTMTLMAATWLLNYMAGITNSVRIFMICIDLCVSLCLHTYIHKYMCAYIYKYVCVCLYEVYMYIL